MERAAAVTGLGSEDVGTTAAGMGDEVLLMRVNAEVMREEPEVTSRLAP
jgi:hypothetical protein